MVFVGDFLRLFCEFRIIIRMEASLSHDKYGPFWAFSFGGGDGFLTLPEPPKCFRQNGRLNVDPKKSLDKSVAKRVSILCEKTGLVSIIARY